MKRTIFKNKLLYTYPDSRLDKFGRVRWESTNEMYELSWFNVIVQSIINFRRADKCLWKKALAHVCVYSEDPMDQKQIYLASKESNG